ncbi:MAG: zinc ribbon domain-containing protein [Anaerolineae bacterium]|jgi:hypothetical protein
MSIGAILVGGALLALSGAYVARPLFKGAARSADPHADPQTQLTARRDAIYALIRELDADHREGKLNDEDYATQRELYVAEGIALLKQLDDLPQDDSQAALDARVEAAVLALRQARAPASEAQQEPAGRFCTQCGHKADPEHSFCGRCGAQLPD